MALTNPTTNEYLVVENVDANSITCRLAEDAAHMAAYEAGTLSTYETTSQVTVPVAIDASVNPTEGQTIHDAVVGAAYTALLATPEYQVGHYPSFGYDCTDLIPHPMLVDFSTVLISHEKKPLKDGVDGVDKDGKEVKAKDIDLAFICTGALQSVLDADKDMDGKKKTANMQLAGRIYAGGKVEVTPEEIVNMKERINKAYPAAVVYYNVDCIFDGKVPFAEDEKKVEIPAEQ